MDPAMKRVQEIWEHPLYQQNLKELTRLEADRIFCRHTPEHFLDVARLAYIFSLERGISCPRELIYCTALLHDIGRAEQYTVGTPHDEAGARIAETILSDLDFSSEEKEAILSAIREHRSSSDEVPVLSQLIYEADKKSRNCFLCAAEPECYWSPQKKNTKGEPVMKIGNREFDVNNRTYIMGILNVTPDSFSDGGKWNTMDHALKHAEAMIADGADILDVGGESTRPGHTPVSAEEEAARVVPVIEALRKHFDVPISVDTYKGSVADVAVQAGADLVNDVWGLKYDPEMAGVIAKHDAACCLMHNKANTEYNNFLIDMLAETQECVNIARKAGIKDERIILDPGVGFGKTYEMNLETMNHLELFQHLGFPVLLGTSRKSMIGLALDLPVDQRVEGTIATSVIGVMKGCAFVRVHDVKENKRAVLMTEAILGRNIK